MTLFLIMSLLTEISQAENVDTRFSGGDNYACFILTSQQTAGTGYDETIGCKGLNTSNSLGDASRTEGTSYDLVPVKNSELITPVEIECAGHTCLVRADSGATYCFGANDDGQCGTGDSNPTDGLVLLRDRYGKPVNGAASTAIDIAIGDKHSVVLLDNYRVFTSGTNPANGDCEFDDREALEVLPRFHGKDNYVNPAVQCREYTCSTLDPETSPCTSEYPLMVAATDTTSLVQYATAMNGTKPDSDVWAISIGDPASVLLNGTEESSSLECPSISTVVPVCVAATAGGNTCGTQDMVDIEIIRGHDNTYIGLRLSDVGFNDQVYIWGSTENGEDGDGSGSSSDYQLASLAYEAPADHSILDIRLTDNSAFILLEDTTTYETSVIGWGSRTDGTLGTPLTGITSPVTVSGSWTDVEYIGTSDNNLIFQRDNDKIYMVGNNSGKQVNFGSTATIISTPVSIGTL